MLDRHLRERLRKIDQAGLAKQITNLMGRVDFVDDVMARVSGPIQLFVRRQVFDGALPTPTPRLPGFALVAPLRIGDAADYKGMLERLLPGRPARFVLKRGPMVITLEVQIGAK